MNTQLPFDHLDTPSTAVQSNALNAADHLADGFDPADHDDTPHVDDPAEGTDRMLEVIAAVDFLRRGDRRGLTLWDAIEEALRWWVAERTALLDGHTEPDVEALRLDDDDPLRTILTQIIATAGQDEPVHVSVALQQAFRRWTGTMADRYNDEQPWPTSRPHHPSSLRLITGTATEGPPDLIA